MSGDCFPHNMLQLSTGVVLNLKKVIMSYVKYECNILNKYKVEIIGWPASIKFANPSKIGTVDEI